jgi:hypothetical protein|tara:strand:+ start:283 stop:549 length:267 start_codon:yes stop_codon:yes gene_type:complete
MGLTGAAKKKYQKDYMKDYQRAKRSKQTLQPSCVPSYLDWIVEPPKRRRMEKVCASLRASGQLKGVTLGYGSSVSLDTMEEMLEVTKR